MKQYISLFNHVYQKMFRYSKEQQHILRLSLYGLLITVVCNLVPVSANAAELAITENAAGAPRATLQILGVSVSNWSGVNWSNWQIAMFDQQADGSVYCQRYYNTLVAGYELRCMNRQVGTNWIDVHSTLPLPNLGEYRVSTSNGRHRIDALFKDFNTNTSAWWWYDFNTGVWTEVKRDIPDIATQIDSQERSACVAWKKVSEIRTACDWTGSRNPASLIETSVAAPGIDFVTKIVNTRQFTVVNWQTFNPRMVNGTIGFDSTGQTIPGVLDMIDGSDDGILYNGVYPAVRYYTPTRDVWAFDKPQQALLRYITSRGNQFFAVDYNYITGQTTAPFIAR